MLGLFCTLQPGPAGAISVGQIDTVEDGTIPGWKMGFNAVTASHTTNITDGRPAGIGDSFFQVVSDGTAVAGGRLTFINLAQWQGDYLNNGFMSISMDLNNLDSIEMLNLARDQRQLQRCR